MVRLGAFDNSVCADISKEPSVALSLTLLCCRVEENASKGGLDLGVQISSGINASEGKLRIKDSLFSAIRFLSRFYK